MPNSGELATQPGRDAGGLRVVVLIIVLTALALRLAAACFTVFHTDELCTLLASQMIWQKGLPINPSGTLRPMGGPLLYLQAPLLGLFGFTEAVVRMPGVICSTLTVWLVYRWGRNLFGRDVALLAAFVMAVDPDAVVWGAYARAYCVLPLVVLLALAALRRAAIRVQTPWARALGALSLVLVVWVHPVVVMWLPAFLIAYLLWAGRLRWREIILPGVICAVGAGLVMLSIRLCTPNLFQYGRRSGGLFSPSPLWDTLRQGAYFKRQAHRVLLLVPLFFCGLGWVWRFLRRKIRLEPRQRDILALGAFLGLSIFGLGLVKISGQHTRMALLPAFGLLGGVALIWVLEVCLRGRHRLRPGAAAGVIVMLTAVAGTAAEYWELFTAPGMGCTQGFRYVQAHWQEGDAMLNSGASAWIFSGPGAKFHYFGEINPGLAITQTPDGRKLCRSLGSPVVDSTEKLRQVLNTYPRVWFVARTTKYVLMVSAQSQEVVSAEMTPVFRCGETIVYFRGPDR